MKKLLLIPFFCISRAIAQDSIMLNEPIPLNAAYIKNIYNPQTKTVNLSYNYSNKWDFNGDNKNDSLFFIGNGAAHNYFYLRIILSSDGMVRDFPSVQLDMPYFVSKELLEKYGKTAGVQLVVDDFDKDNIAEVYLNFNNPFSSIPKVWRQKGVTTKYVLLHFKENKLKVSDY